MGHSTRQMCMAHLRARLSTTASSRAGRCRRVRCVSGRAHVSCGQRRHKAALIVTRKDGCPKIATNYSRVEGKKENKSAGISGCSHILPGYVHARQAGREGRGSWTNEGSRRRIGGRPSTGWAAVQADRRPRRAHPSVEYLPVWEFLANQALGLN